VGLDRIYTRGLTDASKFGFSLDKLEDVEEGNEGVVGSFDQQELERVTVESNAFERGEDRVEDSATSH
jgi:hypothetical protein